jgi:rhodanese-related sulfurtransferase
MQQYLEFAGNHPILVAAWVGLLLAIIYTYLAAAFSKLKLISPAELTLLVNREDAVVLDIRTADEFKKGHITGARNLPLANFKTQLNTLENQKDAPIIVVCYAGMSAQGAAKQLLTAGFNRVMVLSGGMNKWAEANLPVVKK